MTHAHITPHTPILCTVAFEYDEATKNSVKELAGASFDGGLWIVPIMHLPTMKDIFKTLDVDPAVILAYHALLKTMLQQFGGYPPESIAYTHANGIAAVYKNGWKPTERTKSALMTHTTTIAPSVESTPPTVNISKGEQLWFDGVQNAIRAKERKTHMVAAVRRKRKAKEVTA